MKAITINFPGGSLLDIRKKHDGFYTQSWYVSEEFAKKKIPNGTWTVQLEPVEGSSSMTWAEQQALIPEGAVVPPAAVFAYALLEYRKENDEHALPEYQDLRCSDIDAYGDHVYVGVYSESVLVSYDWDSHRGSDLGVAAAWKGTLGPGNLDSLGSLSLSNFISELKDLIKKYEN